MLARGIMETVRRCNLCSEVGFFVLFFFVEGCVYVFGFRPGGSIFEQIPPSYMHENTLPSHLL